MLNQFFQQLYDSPLGTAIREDPAYFPWIESFHVLAITIVVGSICALDLRFMGLASRQRSISSFGAEVLPYTVTAFVVAAITGLLLFSSNAPAYAENVYFIAKMLIMLVALVNLSIFHFITERGIGQWDHMPKPPLAVRAAGAISLCCWIGIVLTGRWIAYTE
jgi:hypothetical protein